MKNTILGSIGLTGAVALAGISMQPVPEMSPGIQPNTVITSTVETKTTTETNKNVTKTVPDTAETITPDAPLFPNTWRLMQTSDSLSIAYGNEVWKLSQNGYLNAQFNEPFVTWTEVNGTDLERKVVNITQLLATRAN